MKSVIVFDSVYGCTKNVSEMISRALKENGWDVESVYLNDAKPQSFEGDLLFIGSPTRIGKATRKTRKLLKSDVINGFSGIAVAFDTIMKVDMNDPKAEKMKSKYIDNGAAPSIKDALSQKGIKVYDELLRVEVSDLKGPLVDEAENVVKEFISRLLSSLSA